MMDDSERIGFFLETDYPGSKILRETEYLLEMDFPIKIQVFFVVICMILKINAESENLVKSMGCHFSHNQNQCFMPPAERPPGWLGDDLELLFTEGQLYDQMK